MRESRQILKNNGAEIPYTIQYKGVKNITLRVKEDGLIVSAPYGTSVDYIEKLITSKLDWVTKVKGKVDQRSEIQSLRNHVNVWGQEYEIFYNCGSKRVIFKEGTCLIYYPNEDYEAYLKSQLRKILANQVNVFRGRYDAIMDDYHLPYPEIRYREMTSRWGSCMPKKAQITLNTRLIHYPKECLDYVLLHEYMHFIEPNHSKSFHALCAYYMPDYKEVEKLLK